MSETSKVDSPVDCRVVRGRVASGSEASEPRHPLQREKRDATEVPFFVFMNIIILQGLEKDGCE